jgi:hypothetical protein
MRAELKISKDPTDNQTQNLPSCGARPQSNAPPTNSQYSTKIDMDKN